MNFAFNIKKSGSREPIYPLTVLQDDEDASRKILQFNRHLERFHIEAASAEESISPMVRIEVSAADGILRAIKEKMITKIVIGWNVKLSASNLILGSLLEKLIEKASKMLMIVHIDKPIESFMSINIFIPPDVENEPGFDNCISAILTLSARLKKNCVFYCEDAAQQYLANQITKQSTDIQGYRIKDFTEWNNFSNNAKHFPVDELLVFINLRPKSYSYPTQLDSIPRILSRFYQEHGFVLVYPEEQEQLDDTLSSRLGT